VSHKTGATAAVDSFQIEFSTNYRRTRALTRVRRIDPILHRALVRDFEGAIAQSRSPLRARILVLVLDRSLRDKRWLNELQPEPPSHREVVSVSGHSRARPYTMGEGEALITVRETLLTRMVDVLGQRLSSLMISGFSGVVWLFRRGVWLNLLAGLNLLALQLLAWELRLSQLAGASGTAEDIDWERDFTAAPARLSRTAVRFAVIVVRVLPRRSQSRYDAEFRSELYELASAGASRLAQLAYAVRILSRMVRLRRALERRRVPDHIEWR